MTSRSKAHQLSDFGFARVRDSAFEAVRKLWESREQEGWTQAFLAEKMGRDRAWVSRNLSGPGNWTLRTFGAFVDAMDGEAEIILHDLNSPQLNANNYDAYEAQGHGVGAQGSATFQGSSGLINGSNAIKSHEMAG